MIVQLEGTQRPQTSANGHKKDIPWTLTFTNKEKTVHFIPSPPLSSAGSLLAGHDMSQVVFSLILNYHGRCSHRLRWIGVGMVFVVAACLSAAIPHLLFGFGRDGFGAELAGFVGNGTMAIAENS